MSTTNESSSKQGTLVWLFSSIGVGFALAILLALNYIVSTSVPLKVDLTEDKVHTLSQGTKQVLQGLDTPVEMYFFVSKTLVFRVLLQRNSERSFV